MPKSRYLTKTNYSTSTTILTEKNVRNLFYFIVALFLIIVLGGGYNYFSSQYNVDSQGVTSSIFKYLFIVFNLLTILLSISLNVVKKRTLFYAIVSYISIVVIVYLATGSRTSPMAILLILSYTFLRNRLKLWQFLFVAFGGIILLSLVGATRSTGVTAEGMIVEYSVDRKWYDYILDMIVTNRNLYDAYDYVQSESITWGLTFLGSILAVVPFAQSLFCNIFGVPGYALGSAKFITFNIFGKDMPLGLGTHIVGDIYMGSGLVGIFVFFFLLGYFVSYSYQKMQDGSFRWMVVFLILLSDSVFMCRSTMFEVLRSVLWIQLFISLFGTKIKNDLNVKRKRG